MKGEPLTPEMLEPPGTTLTVLVDGKRAKCVIGPLGGYSERIRFIFDEKHPEYGKKWMTKYFDFIEPGKLAWGFDGKSMEIMVLDEKNEFDKDAAVHPFAQV